MPDPVLPPVDPAPVVPPAADPPADPQTPEQLKAALDSAQRALKAANAEAAERRVKLAAFEKAEQERQQATLTAQQKLEQQLAEAQKALTRAEADRQQTLIQSAVIAKAAALGFADPQDAYGLLDMAKVTVADGKVAGIDEALAEMAKAKPYMLKRPAQAPLHTGNPGSASAPEETDAQKLKRLYGGNGASEVFGTKESRARGGGVFVKDTKS